MLSRLYFGLICLLFVSLLCITQPSSAQGTATPPPTNTKRPTQPTAIGPSPQIVVASPTPTPKLANIPARLCTDCQRVRLRSTPGSAGAVIEFLDSTTTLTILARSDDSQWLQVKLMGQSLTDSSTSEITGWVAVDFVRDQKGKVLDEQTLASLPVLGVAVQASVTPTSSVGIPGWLSGVSSHSREIFLKGQQLGNRANVFSRVGDSMSASPYFLTPFGGGQYDLAAYGSLSGVVGYYSVATARTGNSFANKSLAAGGGWSAFTLLLPGYSSPDLCGQDSPLVCEYKQVKPAVALIMVGTNDSGSGGTGPFKASLDQIVQTSIDMGVIPVLSTIPPKQLSEDQSARVDAFNQVIRATAAQFDIPLWDYYSAMVNLPNKGMDTDGLHASVPPGGASGVLTPENLQYGYTVRNLMALQVLDTIRRVVMN